MTWEKRRTQQLTCPSGNKPTVQRPGPSVALKAGKILRILNRNKTEVKDIDSQLSFIERLDDNELEKLTEFARVIIADVVVEPVLSLHPKGDQLSPDDLPPNDFWFIFIWAANGGPDMPVATKEGETTVEAVETFPGGQGASADVSENSEQIQ